MSALIELIAAGKSYGSGLFGRARVPALHPLTVRLSEEQPPVIAVVGESGSGKTTLGNILLGLLPPDTGQMLYRGRNVAQFGSTERGAFRREVQAITQDPFSAYNPFYPVDHALTVAIRNFGLATSAVQAHRLAAEACAEVGLNPRDTLGRYPHQLSGGQRQRLMVARALLLRPRLLVADEPVSMVDASLRATILANIVKLNQDHRIAVVYITHDIATAYHVADEVLVLFRGHVVERGHPDSVIGDPRHPYTKLLVNSIPWPDLDRKWGAEAREVVSGEAPEASSARGCPFQSRCSEAMPVCATEAPVLAGPLDTQVACHKVFVMDMLKRTRRASR